MGGSSPAVPAGKGRSFGEHSGVILKESFRLDDRIAESVRAEVYRGEDVTQHRPIAVKILRPATFHEPDALARFKLEVEIVRRLAHPHVARVYDADELAGGRPYVVMELLEGESLAKRVSCDRLEVSDAVRIISQVGAALGAMHRHSIVHRDLRPKKIFLATIGGVESVKILDFGLCNLQGASALHRADVAALSYRAPELTTGRLVADHRVDVFALAVVAYELFTGSHPFAHRGHGDGTDRAKPLPTPPSKLRPEIPAAIDRVLVRALEREPNKRHDSVSRFVAALESAAAGSTTRQRRVRGESPSGNGQDGPPASATEGAAGVLAAARAAFLDGRLDDAVLSAEQVWEAAVLGADPEARRVIATSLSLLQRIFAERIGSLDGRIGVGPGGRELDRFTPKARELIQLSDANITVARLIAASGVPPRDAERMIAGLLRRRALVKL